MEFLLSEEQVKQFHAEGYLVFERFFDESEIAGYKSDMDALGEARAAGGPVPFLCEYPHLGPLISHPKVMDVVEQIMGPGFAFHHLHAVRQDAGTPGVNWHQDYEQEPQTNRSHIMVHLFYYYNGLNGEIGDLLFLPGSHKTVVSNGALWFLKQERLPGEVVVDNLPPGSAVLVHSALWHARRQKPGGEGKPRYFADASYCEKGIQWPSYSPNNWRNILAKCLENGLARDGRYAHLFDETHFFDHNTMRAQWKDRQGSLALDLK